MKFGCMKKRTRIRIDHCADSSERAHTVRKCSLVPKIIQHVEYLTLMASVTNIAEKDTPNMRKQRKASVTSDVQLS